MHDPLSRRWNWQPTLRSRRISSACTPDAIVQRMAQVAGTRLQPELPTIPAELKAETPGPDGVRHKLVAHVQQLIAEGAYDHPGIWEEAEERILKHALRDS